MLETGAKLPAVKLADDTGTTLSTKDLIGGPLVIYFYPKDDTPGCTNEATQFRDLYELFEKHKARVVGVSRDSVASHQKSKPSTTSRSLCWRTSNRHCAMPSA